MCKKHGCLVCGKPKPTCNLKYCSRVCYAKSLEIKERRRCKVCKELFPVGKRKRESNTLYCSRKCRSAGSATRGYRLTCENEKCGKYFYVRKSAIKSRKHCSRKCAIETKKRYRIFECGYCKKMVTIESWRKNRFCNERCASMSTRRATVCKFCKKGFWLPRGRNRVYCSDKCKKKQRDLKRRRCRWCNDIIRNYSAKDFCSSDCRWMTYWYEQEDLQSIQFQEIYVYKDDHSEPIWLPLTSDEIEITLYLHRQGIELDDVIRHVKRWRQAKKHAKNSQ